LDQTRRGSTATLHDLWRLALQASQGSRWTAGEESDEQDDVIVPNSTDLWEVTDPENIGQGLAAIYLHPPASKPNNPINDFPLYVTLSLEQAPEQFGEYSIFYGLKAVYLFPTWTNCQPVELNDVNYIVENGNMFKVLGPRDKASGHIVGRPLANTSIATIQYTTGLLPEVTLALRSLRNDLDVIFVDPDQNISDIRRKVLEVFLQNCQVSDKDSWVNWGFAHLKRKPKT
jgi:hypothetical protein